MTGRLDAQAARTVSLPDTPAPLARLRDGAQLRPVAIARLAGVAPAAFARWTCGTWTSTAAEVPLLPALQQLHARLCARWSDPRRRRAWWGDARRELGCLSPAELLRRGRIGEVLPLLEAVGDDVP